MNERHAALHPCHRFRLQLRHRHFRVVPALAIENELLQPTPHAGAYPPVGNERLALVYLCLPVRLSRDRPKCLHLADLVRVMTV